ncbi:MAG: hypothetical protein D6687_10895 [Acidobacteria bacterium]|jgi:predicted extracellular nuclease|nr:MAG: hypothetical protein D6687_10895 [Acidobacteriota bacterium]GIU81386.1 MAG: hypothetical protein KatS3mg006_0450 [Pyrinomonadaceae bacterium]
MVNLKKAFVALELLFLLVCASAQATLVPINKIQGDKNISPLVGKTVTTRGIVTFVSSRGFYIQTPDSEIDDNPNTSEGIFVFTGDVIPPTATVGNLLEVTGTVTEYRPRNERYFLTITELTNPGIKFISKNNPLPKPVTLTPNDLNPQGKIDQLERYEGMMVKVDSLIVVAPTGGFEDEKTGKVISNGIFFGVLPGTPRPFREPGISLLMWLVDKLPQTIPYFDMNPELLRVDSGAQGKGTPLDVATGMIVKNLVGIIDYSRRAYTLLVNHDVQKPVIEGQRSFIKASPAGPRETTVAFFNMENFFDDEKNSENLKEEKVLPKEVFQTRLNKASIAVRNVLSMPDVLGVEEVENIKVLKKLAEKINKDAEAAGQGNPAYEAFLEEGNDGRGIDVGFLIKTSKVKVIEVKQLAKEEKLKTCFSGVEKDELLYDRPPLMIRVEVKDEKSPLPLTVIVNHFKSYLGIDDEKIGESVRNKRRCQAEWLAKFLVERQKENPSERIVIGGDFNSFQFNDGYNDLIGILMGRPSQNVLTPSNTAYQTGLINLVDFIDPKNRYSYVFDGSAQALDHILLNKPAQERALKFGYARLNADFPRVYANDASRPERLSDHDVPIVYLSLDEIPNAR